MTDRAAKLKNERIALVAELRDLVLNYNGPIEESPHYKQLARLLVSECMTNTIKLI